MKILIAVTHLLGTGHLSRALTLGRAFHADGHEVFVVSGGMPAPHLQSGELGFLNLPPLRSDGTNFTRLLDAQDNVASSAYLDARKTALISALQTFHPDILITELFPFGRRVLKDEFLALLDAAHTLRPKPLICSSIRDILAPASKPSKAAQAQQIIDSYFDTVLVHSDPALTRLEDSWPVTKRLDQKLEYTGYVAPPAPAPHPGSLGQGEILVSAGGGSVGTSLFEAAAKAASLIDDRNWRILVGGKDAAERIDRLRKAQMPENLTIEGARPDFRQMLLHAAASVSMCGYNTAMDLLQAGTPAVLVPFDEGNEVEQTLRAKSLSTQSAVEITPSETLDPDTLAQAVTRVIAQGRRTPGQIRFDGAAQTISIVEKMTEARS